MDELLGARHSGTRRLLPITQCGVEEVHVGPSLRRLLLLPDALVQRAEANDTGGRLAGGADGDEGDGEQWVVGVEGFVVEQ